MDGFEAIEALLVVQVGRFETLELDTLDLAAPDSKRQRRPDPTVLRTRLPCLLQELTGGCRPSVHAGHSRPDVDEIEACPSPTPRS